MADLQQHTPKQPKIQSSFCPFFWSEGRVKPAGRPLYLKGYCESFICCQGNNSSLLSYGELLTCLQGRRDQCPWANYWS